MRVSVRYLVLVLLFAGCAKPSLVGEWKGTQTRDGLVGTARLSLQEDAQFRLTVSVVSNDGIPGRTQQITAGSYKASRSTISMVVKAMQVDGAAIPIPRTGGASRVRYTVDGDTLTLDMGNKSRLVLRRI